MHQEHARRHHTSQDWCICILSIAFSKGDKAWNKSNKVWQSARICKNWRVLHLVLLRFPGTTRLHPPRPPSQVQAAKEASNFTWKQLQKNVWWYQACFQITCTFRESWMPHMLNRHIPLVHHIFVSPAVLKLLQKRNIVENSMSIANRFCWNVLRWWTAV